MIVKLAKRGDGPPAREPLMSEDERKELMLHAYRRQEEIKKLEEDEDDHYMNADWADNQDLKKTVHGLRNISWAPRK